MKRLALPAELKAEWPIVVVDTREQTPLDVSPLRSERGTLTTGDYSIKGLTAHVAVERKSLSDFLGCCGKERERFNREVERLLAFPCRALVIESDWRTIAEGNYERSTLKPQQVMGSLLGWQAAGLPVLLAGDHEHAGRAVARLLFIYANRRWKEARELLNECMESQTDRPE